MNRAKLRCIDRFPSERPWSDLPIVFPACYVYRWDCACGDDGIGLDWDSAVESLEDHFYCHHHD